MLRRLATRILAAAVIAALAAAGCEGRGYISVGDPGYSYVEVTNDTGYVQYVYVDGIYMGSLYPGETAVYLVDCGWHTVEAYLVYGVFVDPIWVDTYCVLGDTFYWWISFPLGAGPAEEPAPQPSCTEPCPDPDESPDRDAGTGDVPAMGSEPVEVF